MSLGDRVPVEPLPPERLARLEQRLVAAAAPALARPARPALWPWGLALASAAAAALAVIALRPTPAVPPPRPLAVSTDAHATTLELGDATLTVGPATRFDVSRPAGGLDVRLDHGVVQLDVAPRRDRPPLWVHAGDVGVRVVGTAFTVSRAPGAGEVAVEVAHGTVEVHRGGTIAAVHGGERWSSRDGAVTPTVLAAATAGATGGAGATADGRIGRADSATADLATGPAIDVAVLGDRRAVAPPPADLAGAADSPQGERAAPRGPTPRPGRPDRNAPTAPSVVPASADPLGDLRKQILAAPLAPASVAGVGTAAERAVALRDLMARRTGADAAAALYGLARLQHVELGKHAEALRSLDAYLTRFPRGGETEAVMWLRLRILCRGAIDDACRAAAHSYATRYPQTARGAIAERVTNVR